MADYRRQLAMTCAGLRTGAGLNAQLRSYYTKFASLVQ